MRSKSHSRGEQEKDEGGGFSRRGLLVGGSAAAAAALIASSGEAAAAQPTAGPVAYATERRWHLDDEDLLLVNGNIHTMDDRDTVVSAVRLSGGRIAAVGREAQTSGSSKNRIDLRGRTVVP